MNEIINVKNGTVVLTVKDPDELIERCKKNGKNVIQISPYLNNNEYWYNPLIGQEDDVFYKLKDFVNKDDVLSKYTLLCAIKVLKRLLGDKATLFDLHKILWNHNDQRLTTE